jgi:transforming growth factor-beta-induced protein
LIPPDVVLPTAAPSTPAPTPSVAAPSPGVPTGPVTGSILDIVQTTPSLSSLNNAVEIGQVGPILNGTDFLTLFGPINSAFAALNQTYYALLLTPPWILHLQDLLSFHTTDAGTILVSDLVDGQEIEMLNDEVVVVEINGGTVTLTSRFSLPNIEVINVDMFATNGVVHEITGVLYPQFIGLNIITLAEETDGFSVFLSLVKLAGLDEELSTGIYTVFAPTDAAFESLPPGTVEFLQDPANIDQLTAVLSYHVDGSGGGGGCNTVVLIAGINVVVG